MHIEAPRDTPRLFAASRGPAVRCGFKSHPGHHYQMSFPESATTQASVPRPKGATLSRVGIAAMTISRWALGVGMLPYGVSKLFDFQFQVQASDYARPLGELSGKLLTWAFLGYSPVFQVLLGALETIPAILLLFRKTRRIGALFLFPVLLNVTLTNYFLDLWPATQRISTVMLALNTFLILCDWRIYWDFFSRLFASSAPIARRPLRVAARVCESLMILAVIALLIQALYLPISQTLWPIADFIGQRQINRAGTWTIDQLRISGREISIPAEARLYFDFSKRCMYSDGDRKYRGKFTADHAHHTFQISDIPFDGNSGPIQGSYQVTGDSLVLDGARGRQSIHLALRRDKWGHPSL